MKWPHDWAGYPKAWKMVDLQHAAAVAEGRLRIGTLNSFAGIENGRADALDGASVIYSGERAEPYGDPVMARRIQPWVPNAGEVRGPQYSHCRFIEAALPAWAFCMSEPGCDFDWTPDVPKAIFEIADVSALAGVLHAHNRHRISDAYVGKVTYRRRHSELANDEEVHAHPFWKDPHFAREREARIIFLPRQGTNPTGAFFTPRNPVIAALFKRVR